MWQPGKYLVVEEYHLEPPHGVPFLFDYQIIDQLERTPWRPDVGMHDIAMEMDYINLPARDATPDNLRLGDDWLLYVEIAGKLAFTAYAHWSEFHHKVTTKAAFYGIDESLVQ